jgi:methyl-accepting chemotaxis protein
MAVTTTRNVEKVSETTREMTRGAQRTGQILSGYLAEVQEINTEFARTATETWIESFRKQTELNQRVVQKLYGEAEGQTGAIQELAKHLMGIYSAPFFSPFGAAPFVYWREGMETAARNVEKISDVTLKNARAAGETTKIIEKTTPANGSFPIAGYDEKNVGEITGRLNALTVEQLQRVKDYEQRNKNRKVLVQELDRKIRNAS